MCTYCGTNKYRKIYENHVGPIPKDSNGRSYEIHHINNDHTDNRIENLKPVTIEEHYYIHKSQGDYVSAFMIAQRMKLSPEELSALASKNSSLVNARRVKDGTHNFLGKGEEVGKRTRQMVKDGTHPFLGGKMQKTAQDKLVASGTHHLLDGIIQSKAQKKKIENGTHNFLIALEKGSHPSQIKVSCIFCQQTRNLMAFGQFHGNKCKFAPKD